MIRLLVFFSVFCFFFTCSYAQSLYESGYFITNSGKKRKCLIKKKSWKENPTSFSWKKNISSKPKVKNIDQIKEFRVGKEYLFRRFVIQFDPKGDDLGRSTKNENPDLIFKEVFLRVVVQSKATLYQYTIGGVHRFFFTNVDKKIYYPKLLTYKVYYTPDPDRKLGTKILQKENLTYKEQLQTQVLCKAQQPEKVLHNQKSFQKYFKTYNQCKGHKIAFSIKEKHQQIQIGIIAAADLLEFRHPLPPQFPSTIPMVYENAYSPRLGVFIESFVPFTVLDLSFFLEVNYQKFSMQGRRRRFDLLYNLNRETINILGAPRFHLYLNKNFGFFVEAGMLIDFALQTTSDALEETQSSTSAFFVGAGFSSGKFKVGYRKFNDRDISKSLTIPSSKLTAASLYITYSIFGGSSNL